jgi:hypothetical protein
MRSKNLKKHSFLLLLFSLSLSLDDTYYTDLDKTSLAGRQAANSFYFLLLISAHIWLILFVTIYACDHFAMWGAYLPFFLSLALLDVCTRPLET